MGKESKFISGLKINYLLRKTTRVFSKEDRCKIIEDYLSCDYSKKEIWEKYTGEKEEHGQLLRWIKEYGYVDKKRSIFATNTIDMKKEKKDEPIKTFEVLQLEKRISELEKQVSESEMKAIAFSTMVDIAEKEFNISIRKKFNTKPLKK